MEIDSTHLEHVLWAVLVIGQTTEITDPTEQAELRNLGLGAPTRITPTHYLKLPPDILTGYRSARSSTSVDA